MSVRVTDLERARALLADDPDEMDEAWLASIIAAARREGDEQASGEIRALRKALHEETMKRLASAKEMRERAARWHDEQAAAWEPWRAEGNALGIANVATHRRAADAIRVLPIAPKEPT